MNRVSGGLKAWMGIAALSTMLLGAVPLALAQAAWPGPTQGPEAATNKSIVFLAEDLRNGGVLGVAQGVKEAVARMGWQLSIRDARGSAQERQRLLRQILLEKPDGLILGGMDAAQLLVQVPDWQRAGIPTVGWHVGELNRPGFSRHTPVSRNTAVHTLPATAHC